MHAKPRDRRFTIVLYDLNVGANLAEQRTDNALRLLEHGAQNVLRLDLLILIALREFNPRLDRFLSPKSEFV